MPEIKSENTPEIKTPPIHKRKHIPKISLHCNYNRIYRLWKHLLCNQSTSK